MTPEARIVLSLGNPICVHVLEEVGSAKRFQERPDVGACVWEHSGAVFEPIGCVGAWDWVVLPAQIAVLRVGAVAEVGPETW
jgi:hypothetical protein